MFREFPSHGFAWPVLHATTFVPLLEWELTLSTPPLSLEELQGGISTYLTPYEHGSKHNLQPIKEVVSNNDHHRSPCSPALAWADRFDARCG